MNIATFKSQIARRKKNGSFRITLCIILSASFVVTYFITNRELIATARRTASEVSDDDRPGMHTFSEKVKKGEDDLLEAWKEE